MQTPAQLSIQHSCYPQTGQLGPSSWHALPPSTPAHSFPVFPAFLLNPLSCHREAFLPLLQMRNQQSEASASNDTKKRLWRIKELSWTVQALDQPCLPEWSQDSANSHQHFQKCLPGKEENTPLTCQVSQLKFSTPFYFLLLPTVDGSKGKEKKRKKKI